VTFFTVLPFTQVIVNFFTTAGVADGAAVCTGVGVGVAVGVGVTSCESFILIVGAEKVKFFALRDNQPFRSLTASVATL
jgi:uncharacterized spore protein YtfJ